MNITLHIILIHFIYLYISICLYKSIRISLYFPTVFLQFTLQFPPTVLFSLQFAPLLQLSPYGRLCTANSRLALRLSIRSPIRFSIRLSHYSFLFFYSLHTLLSYLHILYIHPLYSEYYLLLYPLLLSSLRFFLPRFFSHIFHSV